MSNIVPKNPDAAFGESLLTAANRKTGQDKFSISSESVFLVEPTSLASDDDIITVIEAFGSYSQKLQSHRALTNWNISRLILELSARLGKDYTEVIIDYGIHDRVGVKVSTLLNWLAVAHKLPHDLAELKLDWTMYLRAAEAPIPPDPEKAIEHHARVRDILTTAAANPAVNNSAWVAIEMRKLKHANVPAGMYDDLTMKDRLVDLTNLLRILRLIDGGASIDDTKLASRTDLITAIEECESWAIKRKLIQADAMDYEPHCVKSKRLREEAKDQAVVDVEVVES